MNGATSSWVLSMLLHVAAPPPDLALPDVLSKCKFALEPAEVLGPIKVGKSKRIRFTTQGRGGESDDSSEAVLNLLDPASCRLVVLERARAEESPLFAARVLATKGKLSEKERDALFEWAGVVIGKDAATVPQLPSLGEAPSTGAEIWASKPTKFTFAKKDSAPKDHAHRLKPKECKTQAPWDGEQSAVSTVVPGLSSTGECYELFHGSKFEPAGEVSVDDAKLKLYATKSRSSSLLVHLELGDRFAWIGWVFGVYEPKLLGRHADRIWLKVRDLELGDQLIAIDPNKAVVQRVGLIADGKIEANATGLTMDEAPLFPWKQVVDVLSAMR